LLFSFQACAEPSSRAAKTFQIHSWKGALGVQLKKDPIWKRIPSEKGSHLKKDPIWKRIPSEKGSHLKKDPIW
jgi:hypothetical protein